MGVVGEQVGQSVLLLVGEQIGADLAIAELGPIRDRLTRLLDDRAHVGAVLADGAARARALAAPTLREAQRATGLQV